MIKTLTLISALIASLSLSGPVQANLYSLDDGTSTNSIGIGGGAITWMNQFTVLGGNNTISSISVAWGQVANGTSASIVVWNDPNNDGNPFDAQVVGTPLNILTSNSETDIFNLYDIADVVVSNSFFVGVFMNSPSGSYPASIDETSTSRRSWVAAAGNDLNDLGSWTLPVDLIDNYGFPGNWMIRAESGSSNVPEPASVALLGIGLAGLAATRRRKV
ncbi:MAG: hypothetical protein H6R13_104 [Proteobacteria bacterium]|nr:hypothetical protein [Pseudomonadota bacterium]